MISIPLAMFALDQSSNGGIIVDCETVVIRLQTQTYNSVRDAFRSMTWNLYIMNGFALFDTFLPPPPQSPGMVGWPHAFDNLRLSSLRLGKHLVMSSNSVGATSKIR
ncbi:hypothetical protein AHAS_Ahas19G0131400 [Arachis hypogaea]